MHGVTRTYETMREEEVTLAEAMKKAGYVTGCFGKWHNGAHYPHNPNGQGFDEFLGFCAGHWNNYFDTTLEHNGKPVKTSGYITDVLTDAAIEFIEKNRARPFFCYVAYNAPHAPFQVPDKYFDKYKARGLDDQLACIYGMCENIDDNVGRLLRRLDALDLRDRTVVLFLTDNGANSDRYDGDMKGRKGSIDEGGVRVPLFIRSPGTHQARHGSQADCGQHRSVPHDHGTVRIADARDAATGWDESRALLRGDDKDWPDRMLFTFHSPAGNSEDIRGSVRTQRWRAVKGPKRWELYDMVDDPGQKIRCRRETPTSYDATERCVRCKGPGRGQGGL